MDALELPYGLKRLTAGADSYWYGPYDSVAAANAAVPSAIRDGRTVLIKSGGTQIEYWWYLGVADADLVVKVPPSTALPNPITDASFHYNKPLYRYSGARYGVGSDNTLVFTSDKVLNIVPKDPDNSEDDLWFIGGDSTIQRLNLGSGDLTIYSYDSYDLGIYTGDRIGTTNAGNVLSLVIDAANTRVFFVVSNGGNGVFYELNYTTNVCTKRTVAGVTHGYTSLSFNGTYIFLIGAVAIGTGSTLTRWTVATSTAKNYTNSSGNYTGDLIPTLALHDVMIVGTAVYFLHTTGLFKMVIATEVMKRYTTSDGLPANNIPYYANVGNFLYLSCTGFGIVRFDTTNNAIVNYSPVSTNYTGDAVPATPLLLTYGKESNVLMYNTAGFKWLFDLDTLVSIKIPSMLGMDNDLSLSFDSLVARLNIGGQFWFTTGGAKGVQLYDYFTEAPYYVKFNGYGFYYNFQDGEENNLNAYNFIYRKLFDQYKANTDFSLGALFKLSYLQPVNGDDHVLAGVFTVDETRDRGAIIRFNSASDISIELPADTSNNGLVFTIVQLGAGLLHITPTAGATAVGKLDTAGVNDSLSILDIDGLGTNFLGR